MKRTVLMTSALGISAVLASTLATTAGAKPETRVRDQIPQATMENWLGETPALQSYRFGILDRQYATCFASSAKLCRDMTTGSPESRKAATERYLTLLKSGGNDYPMTQLQKAGVDLTKRKTVQAVVDQIEQLVTQMEAEAAKISG